MTIAAKFLEVQEQLNQKLSPEWAKKGWCYSDAMFTEATEAFNHLNWEWWRATDRKIDWNQVKLEWVDVGHFLFSEIIATGTQPFFERAVERSRPEQVVFEINVDSIKDSIKEFIKEVIKYDSREKLGPDYVLGWFFTVMQELGLTIEQYYTLFIGKVCLNQLRWKNGYKKGIYDGHSLDNARPDFYIKTWDGVEDNVWLSATAAALNPTNPLFKEDLERLLDAKYKEVHATVWNPVTKGQ